MRIRFFIKYNNMKTVKYILKDNEYPVTVNKITGEVKLVDLGLGITWDNIKDFKSIKEIKDSLEDKK